MAGQYGLLDDERVVTNLVFDKYCLTNNQSLSIHELQSLYIALRPDGLSRKQITAALHFICGDDTCDKEDLIDVLKELDRRFYLLHDLKWEFDLLDTRRKGSVPWRNALFLLRMVHGASYTNEKWKSFLDSREVAQADVSFEEIEVDLCNIFFQYDDTAELEDLLAEIDDSKLESTKLTEVQTKTEISRKGKDEKKTKAQLESERKKIAEAKQKEEKEKKMLEEKKMKEEKEKKLQEEKKLKEEKKRKQLEEKKLQEEREKRASEKKKEEEEIARQLAEEERVQEEQRRLEEEQTRVSEEQKSTEEEKKRLEEEERKRMEQEEEERKKKEALENWTKAQLLEQQQQELDRMKQLQETKAKEEENEAEEAELDADEAAEAEERARQEALRMAELAKQAEDEESRKKAEEAEKKALLEARENKIKKIKLNLKASTKSRKIPRIKEAITEAKDSKLTGLSEEVEEAEKVLDMLVCGESLQDAMLRRHLGDLTKSIDTIKKKNYAKDFPIELLEGEKLANKLKRLERLRKEILELNQSTISEIRSYQKPHPAIHQVMIAVYLILGYKEKELKEWKYMQALLGKTGKEGLKRLVTQLEPINIELSVATYADKQYLKGHDLDTIRDISAGAATFFMWSSSMVEEANACKEEAQKRKQLLEEKKKEEEEEKKRLQEKRKLKEQQKQSGAKAERKTPAGSRKTTPPAKDNKGRKATPPSRQPTNSTLRRGRSSERISKDGPVGVRKKSSSVGPKTTGN